MFSFIVRGESFSLRCFAGTAGLVVFLGPDGVAKKADLLARRRLLSTNVMSCSSQRV